ncbi:MAG: acyl-CoA dehydrogenase [Ignavibacteria bacterium]|nr:acyl-CoA dehydrogenase [Ignavibacteria bacterium]MBK7447625.1 acyl-CoA dehydrogenase [Ignavibacteria bacterium]MBK9406355.1 acyl-CoA dehydrogenase [Ignavibacteria bacterium]
MNFDFTEEQISIRDAARDFAENEIAPSAVERDLNSEFPKEIIAKLGELGFMGMMVSHDWGGAGMDTVSYVLAIEEISKHDASVGVIMSVNNSLVCYGLEKWGSDYLKEKYLKPLASGKMLGAFCLSEPEAGSDATQQRTEAVRSGDHFIINGMKNWITNGVNADVYFLQAMTDKSKGYKGISTFIIDKNTEGLEVGKKEDKLGIKSSDTCTLGLNNVKVPAENILGEEGMGFKIAMQTLNGGRIGVAAQALGIAQASFEAAVKYSKQRKAFDSPISNLQAIQFKIADMAVNIEGARLVVLNAAKNKDDGKSYVKEASMGKLLASQAAVNCALEAIQIHGGYGYVREYLVERFLRDSKITQIYEGTSEIQKIVIARELIKS